MVLVMFGMKAYVFVLLHKKRNKFSYLLHQSLELVSFILFKYMLMMGMVCAGLYL